MVTKNLDYYKKLRYKYIENISRIKDGGHSWLVHIEELPDCIGEGNSRPEAFYIAQQSFIQFIQESIRIEREIPEPIEVRRSIKEAQSMTVEKAVTIQDTIQINDSIKIESEIKMEDYDLIPIEPFKPDLTFATLTSLANKQAPIINEVHLAY